MGSHARHGLAAVRDALNHDPDRFTADFYTRLFSARPALRDLFPATMAHQRAALFGVLDHIFEVVPDTASHPELIAVLSQLGRLPPGGLLTGNTIVTLVDAPIPAPAGAPVPANEGEFKAYADERRTQIDMRVAKIIRLGDQRRVDVGVDIGNLLNTNHATTFENNYQYGQPEGGTWNNPTVVVSPRFMRLNFTFNF